MLAHAVPSLDSSVTATLDTLGFGTVSQNSVTELSERLFNRGYSPLQARLVRNAEYVFTGQNIGPVFAATPAAAESNPSFTFTAPRCPRGSTSPASAPRG